MSVSQFNNRDGAQQTQRQSDGGFAFLETLTSAVLLALVVLAVAGAFGTNLEATQQANRTSTATRFLEESMASIDAQSFDNLLVLNGNVLYEHTDPAAARFSITLTVTESAVDLIQVTAVLRDRRANRELARLTTLRSDR
ncbi:MAG: hypothetical protein AAF628_27190 [Planctomycetota bacterium]